MLLNDIKKRNLFPRSSPTDSHSIHSEELSPGAVSNSSNIFLFVLSPSELRHQMKEFSH